MIHHTNVHTTPAVHDDGDRYTAAGTRVPAAEVHAAELADQAGRWLAFATERTRMRPHTLATKALRSTAFSVLRGASSLAVPSKLAGTSGHQRALWGLVRRPAEPWAALALDVTRDGVTAGHGGEVLGAVQGKHLGWVRPLVPFGLTVHLGRVTGHDYEAYTLGCNVVFGHVGAALDGLLAALGSGDGASGDGGPSGPLPAAGGGPEPRVSDGPEQRRRLPEALPVLRTPRSGSSSGPSTTRSGPGPTPPTSSSTARSTGTACATVAHAARHSPSGIEWGYSGSGPADLARSVLLALTDGPTAEALYHAFKADVVVRVPRPGGVLRAADVRAWAAAQSDRPPAA